VNTPEKPDEPARSVYAQIIAALERKALDRKTPCGPCGAVDWNVDDHTFALLVMDAKGNPVPDSGIEVASIFCGNCGYLRLHVVSELVK
jgi:hypothetical protein